jgi:hypothetical protein
MSFLYRALTLTNGINISRSCRRNDGKIFSTVTALVGVTSVSFQSDRRNYCFPCCVSCEGNDNSKGNKKDNDDEDAWEKFLSTVKKVIDGDAISWDKIATISGSKVSFAIHRTMVFYR